MSVHGSGATLYHINFQGAWSASLVFQREFVKVVAILFVVYIVHMTKWLHSHRWCIKSLYALFPSLYFSLVVMLSEFAHLLSSVGLVSFLLLSLTAWWWLWLILANSKFQIGFWTDRRITRMANFLKLHLMPLTWN